MARTIQSPGVQITEIDLSSYEQTPTGTIIVVPGFAAQGPTNEPLFISSVSELEQIYGAPTTPAERYFHYSCREVLNSPGRLTTVRLGYGANLGDNFSNSYSALLYPMTSAVGTAPALVNWSVLEPLHITLTKAEYDQIASGNFNWAGTDDGFGAATFGAAGGTFSVQAGFIVVNDIQSTINEIGEGYYVGLADNTAAFASSSNYESIVELKTITSSVASTFASISLSRLDFSLSATDVDSLKGIYSVSEALEKVGFVAFATDIYQDYISFGLFKVRRSVSDHTKLSLGVSEKYLGSLDANRKRVSPSGGVLDTAFLEEMVANNSPAIKMFTNPLLTNNFDWTSGGTTPTSRITIDPAAKALFPLGTYVPYSLDANVQKVIGSVPGKLEKALRLLNNVENTDIDIIIDAGLSTIHSTTQFAGTTDYNDATYIPVAGATITDWSEVASILINFSENTRKDCFTILDAPRCVFIAGKDSKIIDLESRNFTTDIYNPLKACASFESSYGALYANWIKKNDVYTGRKFWQPISGAMAAVYAKSDAISHPWYAPAGTTRGKFMALDIAINPSLKQRDRLYEISVNPVCYFQTEGYTVMGQKTLQTKPTAFDRINVRRLFLALERATVRALKPFVFEPNTEFTRTKVKTTIVPIMDLAKNTQGLYDYLVIVDERNNKVENIDNNEMIVDIYIKPVKAAEFILVNFIATRTGQSFSELM